MNKKQKDYIQSLFNDEKEVLKAIEKAYHDAVYDIVTEITSLEEFTHNQAKIYQKRYQEKLLETVNKSFNKLLGQEYKTISEYLEDCFTNGYVGTMYDLHGQDIPLVIPFSHEEVVDAITKDTKLKSPLYQSLGMPLNDIKKRINNELARGILNNDHYDVITRNISNSLNLPKSKAKTIARTEGHRVTMNASFNAQTRAKERGADIVKQWNSTLDSRTRPSHCVVDGELRELDETFSNGLIYPGHPNGPASEVINCRCVLLQRARWALDEEELETLKERAKYFELDKEDNFKEFKEKYLKNVGEQVTLDTKRHVGVEDMDEEMKKRLVDYTNGLYRDVTTYTQYKYGGMSEFESYVTNEKIVEKTISEYDKKTIEFSNKLYGIIQQANNDQQTVIRTELNSAGSTRLGKAPEIGKTLRFGIKSASSDEDFATKVARSEIRGLHAVEDTEEVLAFRIKNATRYLDISSLSSYDEQKEVLIAGSYKVEKVTRTKIDVTDKFASWELKEILLTPREYAKKEGIEIEYFTSKAGNKMIRVGTRTYNESCIDEPKIKSGYEKKYVNVIYVDLKEKIE